MIKGELKFLLPIMHTISKGHQLIKMGVWISKYLHPRDFTSKNLGYVSTKTQPLTYIAFTDKEMYAFLQTLFYNYTIISGA